MEYVIIWLLFGMVAAVIANSKGRSGCIWFLLGVLLGPFSLVVLVLPSLKPGQEQPSAATHVQCPDCAELIRMEARVCKHCGCRLVPQAHRRKNNRPLASHSTQGKPWRTGWGRCGAG